MGKVLVIYPTYNKIQVCQNHVKRNEKQLNPEKIE